EVAVGDLAAEERDVPAHQRPDRLTHPREEALRDGFPPPDDPLPVGGAIELADDVVLPEPPEHDVEAAVGELLDADHLADRPGGEDLGTAVVLRLPVTPEEHHPDQPSALRRVPHHRPVAGFEDVEGKRHPGEENDVREREERDDVGKHPPYRSVRYRPRDRTLERERMRSIHACTGASAGSSSIARRPRTMIRGANDASASPNSLPMRYS